MNGACKQTKCAKPAVTFKEKSNFQHHYLDCVARGEVHPDSHLYCKLFHTFLVTTSLLHTNTFLH